MARSRRGGGSVSRAPARPAPSRSVPQTRSASSVPAPAQASSGGGGMLSGIGSTIAQGMAFGTGSAVAHRAVGAVAGGFGGGSDSGPAQEQQAPVYAQGAMPQQQQMDFSGGACAQDKTMFYDCLQMNRGDQQACQFLYEQLKSCQMNEPQFG